VNGAEISLYQVNHLLSKAGSIPQDQLERARKGVVDRLIDQELLATKAVEQKLDRTPETSMAIELARREILARARIEQLMASGAKLGPGDVTRYYGAHPELFSERQVYSLQEISFPTQKDGVADLQALVDKGASLNDIQEFLKGRNIQFSGSSGIRAAEQLPADFLKVLHTAKATASPAIRRFLINQRVAETTTNELKALKESAKIDYVGSLADLPKTAESAPQQGAGGPAAPLPQLPQMDQMPIGTPAK
jgi:EpsD family peptidyl-prolyl cis-trans isomerase